MALKAPTEFALFYRTSDNYKNEIFLLSPGASRLAASLGGGTWTDAGDPRAFGWSLLVGHADAFNQFGLTPSSRKQSPTD